MSVLAFLPFTARADTDYRCLNLCANSGKPASVCMTRCTYQADNAKNSDGDMPPTDDLLSKKRVLPTLQHPVDDKKIAPDAPTGTAATESKDYKCVNQCLQAHMQYQTCNQQCTTITAADGTIIQPNRFKPDETGVEGSK